MLPTQNHHESLKTLLLQRKWDDAQALWLDLAEKHTNQPDFLLLLVKEFADAGQPKLAAELASLMTAGLKSSGKTQEWLYALKLQAGAVPVDKTLRPELLAAYQKIYETDPRLKAILAVAQIDQATGSLPAAIAKADTLLALKTGSYCLHKSWGVGKVKTFDAPLNRIVIAFTHNPDHAMQLMYAADSLAPVNPDHVEVRKLVDLAGLKQLAATDPVAVVRLILAGLNHSASADKMESILCPAVIASADWKKWWEGAKKLLKKDSHFDVPAKKIEPVILRSTPVAQQDELLEAFRVAPSLTQKTDTARQFLKIVDDIADPELLLSEFQDGLLVAIKKLKAEYAVERLEAVFLVEELCARQKTPAANTAPLVNDILLGVRDLAGLLADLTAASQKRALAALQASQPDRLFKELNRMSPKILDTLTEALEPQADKIVSLVRNQVASPDLLVWIYKNLNRYVWLQPLQDPTLLLAMITAIEEGGAKPTKRLRDLFFADEELIPSLIINAETDTVRDVARRILNCPNFEELDRRSLMARIVKDFPFVQEFLVTKAVKDQPLVVSMTSYQKRQAELEDIIKRQIPQNSKEIGIARSYGDLRENFEFKAAKDTQKLLMRRRAELEILLSRAQTTDFGDVKTDIVSIGTSVTVTDLGTNQKQTYHILGAWDSDTTRNVISYPAALAQQLLNKPIGTVVEWSPDNQPQRLRIDTITKVPGEILHSL
jgi:transcription elongation factor GreA-like protein/transcription elongation GreA/GreB family factor